MRRAETNSEANGLEGGPGRLPGSAWRSWSPQGRRGTSRSRALAALLGVVILAATLSAAPPVSAAARDSTYNRIAAATRYETAAEIAEEFRGERGNSIDNVILVSGEDEHFGYALIAPALARRYEAPVLLTEPDRLSNAARRFIDRRDIEKVYIIGGTEAVSERVESDTENLNVNVQRIGGNDVYATAAAVAERVGERPGQPGTYDTHGRTALLATSATFADGLAAGPLAYRGEHPILLTPKDQLHSEALKFLLSSDTEHVVILGGTAAISSGVERELRDNDLTTARLAGSDRFDTASVIARELLGSDSPQDCFGGDEVGLANGWRPPDALVSAPLLGERCAPLLITDRDGLSSATESLLASEEYFTGDSVGDLVITVFGGTAAVSSTAASQADDAATLTPITATIEALEGRCQIVVTFSEPVQRTDAEDLSNYRHDGDRLGSSFGTVSAGTRSSTTRAVITLAGASAATSGTQAVDCTTPLERGDRFEIFSNSIRSPDGRRVVRGDSRRVSRDNSRPVITFLLVIGEGTVYVEASEPVEDDPDLADDKAVEVTYRRAGQDDVKILLDFTLGDTETTVSVPPGIGDSTVIAGDSVRIEANLLVDVAGNKNAAASQSAITDNLGPRISRAFVSESPSASQASKVALSGLGNGGSLAEALTISGKLTGAAAGAAGNKWTVSLRLEQDWDALQRTTVAVNSQRQELSIVASPSRTVERVASDLNSDRDFKALFSAEASRVARSTAARLTTAVTDRRFAGGTSAVDVVVTWNEKVIDCGQSDGVRADLLGVDTDGDGETEFYLNGRSAGIAGVRFVLGEDGDRRFSSNGAICDTRAGAQPGTLVARIESSDVDALPSVARSRLLDEGGAAVDRFGNESDKRHRRFSRLQ